MTKDTISNGGCVTLNEKGELIVIKTAMTNTNESSARDS